MMNPAVIDGARLLSWARRAAQVLEAHREEINSLNVFPVPDSDTGSNMAHTMSAAVRNAESLGDEGNAADIASALAIGSVKGARGNSGVVLSQVLRGVAQAAAVGDLDGSSVADALNNAVEYVERAINDPVEGTIVTVLREAASASRDALTAADGDSLTRVTSAAVAAAEDALEKTPSQLPELRAAGVVDAGGRGLVLLLTALRDEVAGADSSNGRPDVRAVSDQSIAPDSTDTHGHTGWLEVMFMFSGPVDDLEASIATLGTSLVIARATDSQAMVHIHSLDAGAVIEQAYALGAVSDLRLEILPDAAAQDGTRNGERLVVAITPAGSMAELFRQAGAVAVQPGPDFEEQLGRELARSGAKELVILPNGQAGSQEMQLISGVVGGLGADVAVLSTQRLVGGIAALAVHDPRLPLDVAAAQMDEAAEDMRAADIVATQGQRVAVLAPEGAVLVEDDSVKPAVDKACRIMLADGGELVTLLLDADAAAQLDVAALEDALDAEVQVYPVDGLDGVGVLGQIGVE